MDVFALEKLFGRYLDVGEAGRNGCEKGYVPERNDDGNEILLG